MEQEINIYTSLHTLILQRWKRMLLFTIILTSLVAGILFSLPRYYSATIQVIPESSSGGMGLPKNLSELSSLAGLSIGTNNGKDAINPDIYPDIFNSNNFIIDILKLNVTSKTKETISYYSYLTFHQQLPWWNKVVKTVIGNKKIRAAHSTSQRRILIVIKKNSSRKLKTTFAVKSTRKQE